jgi:hypothetical protein
MKQSRIALEKKLQSHIENRPLDCRYIAMLMKEINIDDEYEINKKTRKYFETRDEWSGKIPVDLHDNIKNYYQCRAPST